jgi:uncharacterized protein YjbJ (UPF0337 family)
MELIDKNGTWKEQKVKLKKRFAILMDSDLILEEGNKQEMFAKLQLKLGKTKDELHIILNNL